MVPVIETDSRIKHLAFRSQFLIFDDDGVGLPIDDASFLVDVLSQLRMELIVFSLALFGKAALPLCFFGTVLPLLGTVPFDFAANGAFVAV